jgi:hypothetical protein
MDHNIPPEPLNRPLRRDGGTGRFCRAFSTLEKIIAILIDAAALVMAILSVIAAWKSIALAEQGLALQTNTTQDTADASWQIALAANRLLQLINATIMGDRLLLMQFFADHPVRLD